MPHRRQAWQTVHALLQWTGKTEARATPRQAPSEKNKDVTLKAETSSKHGFLIEEEAKVNGTQHNCVSVYTLRRDEHQF